MKHDLCDEVYELPDRPLALLQEYVDVLGALDIHDCYDLADCIAAEIDRREDELEAERRREERKELEYQEWLREEEAERRYQEWKERRHEEKWDR